MDVSNNLFNRNKLSTSLDISIKPDLSPNERKIKALLMKERYNLITSGTDCRLIRIRGNTIFVNKKKYGEVVNFTFQKCLVDNEINLVANESNSENPPSSLPETLSQPLNSHLSHSNSHSPCHQSQSSTANNTLQMLT